MGEGLAEESRNPILESMSKNWIFYITLVFSLYMISIFKNKSLILLLFSIIIISFIGYMVHVIAHIVRFTTIYEKMDNVITRNKYTNILGKKICSIIDFHSKTHHNASENKKPMNLLYEFVHNIFMEGVLFIILRGIANLVDYRIALLWAFFYATVHIINYSILKPVTHMQHHANPKTNYGIDIWDIILGTKSNMKCIENHSHASINLILITIVILLVT